MQAIPVHSAQSPLRVLRIDASARVEGSVTRQLADQLVDGLATRVADLAVTRRDLARGLPFVDADWIAANFTDPDARSDAQRETLAGSDALVEEVRDADVWGSPPQSTISACRPASRPGSTRSPARA